MINCYDRLGSSSTGTSGEELTADPDWLVSWLCDLDRWLLVEVEFKRSVESRRSTSARPDDESLGYIQPYTKYFLLDTAGELHDL